MGTYQIGEEELAEKIGNALDSIQGDFSKKDVEEVFAKIIKLYPYFNDTPLREVAKWEFYLNQGF